MRAKLSPKDLDRLFKAVTINKHVGLKDLASLQNVSERTVRDWKKGVSSLPEQVYDSFLSMSGFRRDELSAKFFPDHWHIKEAARKGGYARMRLYGNLGTTDGRRKGGLASIKTHTRNNTGFKVLKQIEQPKKSEALAELIGILIGDGHLSYYQVSVTTNSRTDMEHAMFVKEQFYKLFKLNARIAFKKDDNAVNVVVSSKGLVNFLHILGMPIGNKIKNNLSVPSWIFNKEIFQKAFVRGLFDTDGCVYLDKHVIRGKQYRHLGWTITSYAPALIQGVKKILASLKFNPTHRSSQKSVFLRRQGDIKNYFLVIGTHNSKHLKRFQSFLDISNET